MNSVKGKSSLNLAKGKSLVKSAAEQSKPNDSSSFAGPSTVKKSSSSSSLHAAASGVGASSLAKSSVQGPSSSNTASAIEECERKIKDAEKFLSEKEVTNICCIRGILVSIFLYVFFFIVFLRVCP